jgi:hypothetical protein
MQLMLGPEDDQQVKLDETEVAITIEPSNTFKNPRQQPATQTDIWQI